ncbi:uracil-DNA glycosylase family protein [Treponema parvum]|uniref:Uracil-DNA glycosylase family protein n=1 Tax=Treponema parvum TaxID=138851 RepID=A0A975F159_9SPIR|nr:uracil-DNA glycosylase family protein [Treponema parvum]QTQ12458.1 uracil-DNA glycosylase family protein [Treponema parvum]
MSESAKIIRLKSHAQTPEAVIHTIEPVFNSESAILILGTMPSPASRRAGFYYMHPQNRFWPIMAEIYGEKLKFSNKEAVRGAEISEGIKDSEAVNVCGECIEERRRLALKHGIALWDVLKYCQIAGADDASIRSPEPNDIPRIIENSRISKIFCTGKTAFNLYKKFYGRTLEKDVQYLPSTSPANRGKWPTEKLLEFYREKLLE